jgi:membrane associated rhomboid family serine protease
MIIIPVNTDAPIYHWPWMTLLLVAINAVTFIVTGFGENPDGWLLRFGQGLNPVEWVAYSFLHAGWLHLVGNMIFVWGFGIVVEGKLGWWRFLLVYLSIGVLGGVLIQTVMLGHDPSLNAGSQGASLIVYGLLAICVVWAPKNEMDLLIFLGYRVISAEVTILTFGFWYVALQVLSAWWNQFSMGSAMGHLIGAFWGFGIGIALLKLRWVDCENWDLFAIWNGTYRQPTDLSTWTNNILVTHSPDLTGDNTSVPEKIKKKKAVFRPSIYLSNRPQRRKPTALADANTPETGGPKSDASPVKRSMSESALPPATLKVLDRMRELLRAGKPQAALVEYRKRRRIVDHWPLDANDLQAMADGLFKLKLWDETVPLLEEFIERFPSQADAARIKLAAICCEVQNRPLAALKLLDKVDLEELPDSIRGHIAQIRQKAERLLDEDPLEPEGKNW